MAPFLLNRRNVCPEPTEEKIRRRGGCGLTLRRNLKRQKLLRNSPSRICRSTRFSVSHTIQRGHWLCYKEESGLLAWRSTKTSWRYIERFFHSNEYREWQYGRRFKAQKFVKGDIDFREYKRLVAVAGHSEIGYGDRYYSTAPKWYVRTFLNRPFRQKHKREIKKTLAMRDEYDVVLSPLKKSASYYW